MVGMAVRTVRTECQHNVRFDAADEWHDLPLRLRRIGTVEVSVDVIEKMNLADTQFPASRTQLGLTHFTDPLNRGPHGCISEAAALSSCCCNEIGFDSLFRVSSESPAHPQRFIVGMRQDAHQSEIVSHSHLPLPTCLMKPGPFKLEWQPRRGTRHPRS